LSDLQELKISLDVDNHQRVKVSADHERLRPLVSPEDILALQQRLQLLNRLWDEVNEQIGTRCKQIESRIEQWSDFDDRCNRLKTAIAKAETSVNGNSELPIEDIITLLKTVSSSFCFSSLG
jgi:seryl-tRNA(Sec) selenium transferase